MRWIKILNSQEASAPGNFIRLLNVGGKKICLVKLDTDFFATQSRCPHAGADLSQGFCKDRKLICAFHRYEYDLQTGRGAPGQGDYINVYPLKHCPDGLYIGLKEPWNFIKRLLKI
jgi:nitrite reductase/ring-hydroxylating ferredoxin subunit